MDEDSPDVAVQVSDNSSVIVSEQWAINATIVLIKHEKTSVLIKHEEAEAEAVLGHHADDKPATPAAAHAVAFTATLSDMSFENFDDGARDDFALNVAIVLGVPCDGVRVTGAAGAHAGSVIVETSVIVDGDAEAAAAFASSLNGPEKPLVNGCLFGPCAVSVVRIEELTAAAAAVPEETPAEAPAEPAPPATLAVADNGPLRSTVVVFHCDDENGGLWDTDNDDSLAWTDSPCSCKIDEEEEAMRRTISDDFHAERSGCTNGLKCREESPSPPAPDDARATGRTYDDITKSPPAHLRCVVSPLSSLSPVLHHRCVTAAF